MAGKHYNYFEVLNQDTIRSISSPECASKDAKWIIKEEYIYACNSYTHSEFFFINNEGQNIPVSVSAYGTLPHVSEGDLPILPSLLDKKKPGGLLYEIIDIKEPKK